jgi:hypothetical protein
MAFGDKLNAHLKQLATKMSGSVEVGFLEDAKYPDGTYVAAVAEANEYGASGPPRPFFRTMIAQESPTWGPKLAGALKHTNGDGKKALAIVGDNIQGALIQSINDFTSPALAPSTIKRKGFDKPLIDSSHMVNSTGSRVVD